MKKKDNLSRPGLVGLLVAVWLLAGCTPATVMPTPSPGNTPAPTATPQSTVSSTLHPTPNQMAITPPPNLVYCTADGLWQTDGDGQSVHLFDRPDALLSPDGTRVLYLEEDDLWLADLTTGERRNLTTTPERIECCPRWWPARPDVVIFGSWPRAAERGPNTGYLTTIQVNGNGYRVLEEESVSYAWPAPAPDGQTIAYDRESTAWLYRWGAEPEPFAPVVYGLSWQRIASPAWSPDGKRLAWVVGGHFDDQWQIGVGVFDLGAQTARLLHPYEPIGMGGWPPAPVWSPDGQWLAFHAIAGDPAEHGLWIARVDGEKEHFLRPGEAPIWSPDGRWLAEVGTWHPQQINLPPGAQAVGWVVVG